MKERYLKQETCNMMRGGAAFIIMLHHLSGYVSYGKPLDFILNNIGALMATVFFFYSGYGLMYNLKHKEGYMNSFVKRRLPNVIFPYLLANIFYILYQLLTGSFPGIAYYVSEMRKGYTLVPYSWYVIVIILLYCIFYISFKWLNPEKGIILCILLNIAYMLFIYIIGFGEWWYNTCFAFSFGIVFSMYYDKANAFLQKKPVQKFGGFLLLFLMLLVVGKFINQVYVLMLIKSLRAVVFCLCMLYFSMLLQKRILFLEFLGNLSFEIYLYQGFAISICWNYFSTNILLFTCMTLIATLITSYVMNKVNSKIHIR